MRRITQIRICGIRAICGSVSLVPNGRATTQLILAKARDYFVWIS